jgi:CBS domain-containing protein
MNLLEQKGFISSIPPFDALSSSELELLTSNLVIEYFKKDHMIVDEQTEEQNLYFIIKGKVQEIADGSKESISILGKDSYFDPLSLIEHRIKNHFKAIEETICYLLPKEIFLKVVYQNSKLEHFFFQSISEKLSENLTNAQNKELANFMVARVSDAYVQKPLFVEGSKSIYETVKFMKENSLTSILVKRGDEFGIATDTDFRVKVILQRLSFDERVESISTFGLKSIKADDFLFNAQLLMTRYNIKRLLVTDKEEQIVGILDQMSLTSFFSSHTYAIANEIDRATSIEELKEASAKFIRIIQSLFAKGVKVRYISKLLNELNRKLFQKIFFLIAPTELTEHSALLVLGSEGRSEQILRTDQDNALIIADDCTLSDEEIMKYMEKFSEVLCDFGYPECSGKIMVNNPLWSKRESAFKEQVASWINRKDKEDFMNLAIFVDANCAAGDATLLEKLKEFTNANIEKSAVFLTTFASFALLFPTPLGLFNDLKVDKNKHKNQLDLKKGGIFPIVHGIRVMALENELKELGTIDRLKELNNLGVIDKEFTSELIETFNFLHTLKLKESLKKIEQGEEADNYIKPDELSTLDRDMLKDAFKIINRFKKFLTSRYRLEYV